MVIVRHPHHPSAGGWWTSCCQVATEADKCRTAQLNRDLGDRPVRRPGLGCGSEIEQHPQRQLHGVSLELNSPPTQLQPAGLDGGSLVIRNLRKVPSVPSLDQRPSHRRIDQPVGGPGCLQGDGDQLRQQGSYLMWGAGGPVEPGEFGVLPESTGCSIEVVQQRVDDSLGCRHPGWRMNHQLDGGAQSLPAGERHEPGASRPEPAPVNAHEPPEMTLGLEFAAAVGALVGTAAGVPAEGRLDSLGEGVEPTVGVETAGLEVALLPGRAWLTRTAARNIAPVAPIMARLVQRLSVRRPSSRVAAEGDAGPFITRVCQMEIRNSWVNLGAGRAWLTGYLPRAISAESRDARRHRRAAESVTVVAQEDCRYPHQGHQRDQDRDRRQPATHGSHPLVLMAGGWGGPWAATDGS